MKNVLKKIERGIVKGAIWIYCKIVYRFELVVKENIKDGAAFFAVRSGAPVVPCGIKGGEKGNRKVTITYGKPLDFSEYKGSKDKEVLDKVTEEIMGNILELAK